MENILTVFEQQIERLERMRSQAERQMVLGEKPVENAIKAEKARFAINQIYACIGKLMEAQPSRNDVKDAEGDFFDLSNEFELFPEGMSSLEKEKGE